MPKPRRRRRFFALEGRSEVGDSGNLEGVVDPTTGDPATLADDDAAPGEVDPTGPHLPEAAGADQATEEEELPPAFRLNRSPRARPAPKRIFSRWSALLSLVCLGVGVLVGRLWPKPTEKPGVAELSGGARKTPILLTAADQDDLDAAYAARHAREYTAATELFNGLVRRHPDWGAVEVERGRTLFYNNESYAAGASLKSSVEKGWKPAEAHFLLGVLEKTRKAYPEAESSFAQAVAIDPTAPEYYFFWGECLREEGKLLDATAKFRSALLRNQYETATGLYRTKLWLCAIEADQEAANGVNAQVEAALAERYPPMEAFVAAAALDLKAGNFGAAAVHLARARRRADATVFRYVIGDPLFAPASARPELAEFFQSGSPATEGKNP